MLNPNGKAVSIKAYEEEASALMESWPSMNKVVNKEFVLLYKKVLYHKEYYICLFFSRNV